MGKPPLVITRSLPATPEVVFEQWSDPESVAIWMQPGEDMSPATVALDFRVGGGFEIVMHGERDFRQSGRYLEIEHNRRIVFEWISDWMPEGERETRVTVTFDAEGSQRTRIVLTHELLPDGDAYDGHQGGWTRILACLDQEIARRLTT